MILDKKIALIDTVKKEFSDQLLTHIAQVVDPKKIDLVISNHTEMDHSGGLPRIMHRIGEDKPIYCSKLGSKNLTRHFRQKWNYHAVENGETLNLGSKTLTFLETRMVHWPDSMFTYLLEDKIALETERFFIVTKLISSTYPDLSAIIPKKIETSVLLHKEELMTLLRQVALFSPEKQYSACFSFDKGELKLLANTMEVGEGKVSMPANWQGPKIDIAFNPIYFLDILKHCKNETVTLSLIDAFNPGIITDTDEPMSNPTEAKPLFILMPMNLSKVAGQS